MANGTKVSLNRALRHRSNRRLLWGAAGAAALGIHSVMRPDHTMAQNETLNILAPAWPQRKEQGGAQGQG